MNQRTGCNLYAALGCKSSSGNSDKYFWSPRRIRRMVGHHRADLAFIGD